MADPNKRANPKPTAAAVSSISTVPSPALSTLLSPSTVLSVPHVQNDPDPPPRLQHLQAIRAAATSVDDAENQWFSLLSDWLQRNQYYTAHISHNMNSHPWVFGELWGRGFEWWLEAHTRHLVTTTVEVNRRLDDMERYTLSSGLSPGLYVAGLDRPIATGLAGVLAFRGWDSWAFCGYRPRFVHFDPNRFPSPRVPLLRGVLSRTAWRGSNILASAALAYGLCEWAGLGDVWADQWMAHAWITTLSTEPMLSKLAEEIDAQGSKLSQNEGNA